VQAATLVACAAALVVPAHAAAAHYYLALGDSLAVGFESPPYALPAGYADDLYARLRRRQRDLQLCNFACVGATIV
jgi:hypothetical protein